MNWLTGQRSWAVTAISGILTLAYLYFLFLPIQKDIAAKRDEVQTKQDFIVQANGLTEPIKQTLRQLDRARLYEEQWRDTAPREGRLAELFGTITDQITTAGTETRRFDPQPVTKMGTVWRIPVGVACLGNFSEIFEMLRRIESLPMSIWISDMTIKPEGENSEILVCEVNLAVFADNRNNSD